MKILTGVKDQIEYRLIQQNLFGTIDSNVHEVMLLHFSIIQKFDYSWLGSSVLFENLKSKFLYNYSEFCIATILHDEPIYLLDFKEDELKDYYNILNNPKAAGLKDLDEGLSITHEKLFFFNPQSHWCLFADRYNDIITLASSL